MLNYVATSAHASADMAPLSVSHSSLASSSCKAELSLPHRWPAVEHFLQSFEKSSSLQRTSVCLLQPGLEENCV
jgi:hypothetical protein